MKKTILILVLCSIMITLSASPILVDKDKINPIDRSLMVPYNKTLDKTSTILSGAAMLAPAAILIGGESDLVTVGTMYAETLALTWGTKEILKSVVDRGRPYLYEDGAPLEKKEDWYDSFPSGHTSMAFAGAAFTSYVFGKYYPDSQYRIPLTAASYALAATVAGLRIASGSHYLTDVLTGAAIGTAYGLLVPYLHTKTKNAQVGVTPFGLVFALSF